MSEAAHGGEENKPGKRAVRSYTMRDDKKMERLLEALPEMVGRRFLYDDEARFSITRSNQALELCTMLATVVDPSTATICDACACVGGNAIFFDRVFAHTTCIEIDPIRAACLRSNLLSANPQSFAFPPTSSSSNSNILNLLIITEHAHTKRQTSCCSFR